MKLRVAHIIGSLQVGGAERNLVNLLNVMSCEYRAAIFVGPRTTGPSFHNDLDAAVEQHFVRIRRRNVPVGIFRLARLLRLKRINVVHAHMFDACLYTAIAASLVGVPVVVTTEHGENPWKNDLHRWLERRVVSPLVDLRFCVSPQILEIRQDLDGVPAEKLRLTVNGTFLRPPKESRETESVPVVGTMGRFIPAKDYPTLVKAIDVLRRRGDDVRLQILGDGPEKQNVVDTIRECNLEEAVQLPGMVSDVDHWLEKFDIYVSSSVSEGQPVALLEAMAHGLPIVATDVGLSADTVVDGEGGIIVSPGDPAAIAEAIGQLLHDPGMRNLFGKNARARIQAEYGVDAVAESHLTAYRQILAKKRPA